MSKKAKVLVLLVALGIFWVIIWKSQEERLNAYSEWYCSEVYGLNPDCTKK
jgi:preprotein translocase subunit YajC